MKYGFALKGITKMKKDNREIDFGSAGVLLIEHEVSHETNYYNLDTLSSNIVKAKIGLFLPCYMDYDKKVIDRTKGTISSFNVKCY